MHSGIWNSLSCLTIQWNWIICYSLSYSFSTYWYWVHEKVRWNSLNSFLNNHAVMLSAVHRKKRFCFLWKSVLTSQEVWIHTYPGSHQRCSYQLDHKHSAGGYDCQVTLAFISRNALKKFWVVFLFVCFFLFPAVLVAIDLPSVGTLKSTVVLILTSALLTILFDKQIIAKVRPF